MHASGVMSHLLESSSIKHKLFTLCFTPTGGFMSVGFPLSNPSRASYTPLTKVKDGYFAVTLVDLLVDDISVANTDFILSQFNKNRGVIFDSGTTDTYLPRSVGSNFRKAWERISGWPHDNQPHLLSKKQFEYLPSLNFVFEGGATLSLHPSMYMEADEKKFGQWTNRIYIEEPSGSILGANAFLYHEIIFDEQALTLGFVPSDCNFIM